jgi:hypothetical protein
MQSSQPQEGGGTERPAHGVIPRRVSAEIDSDFVVFLIGMRINRPWKLHKWLPVFRAMPRMLKELQTTPALGLLGMRYLGRLSFVQYWRSFEHLEAYARAPDHAHWPAWVAFNRAMKDSRGDVGIWHETYLISAGRYETVYSGVPRMGLGAAGRIVEAVGRREGARGRVAAAGEPS